MEELKVLRHYLGTGLKFKKKIHKDDGYYEFEMDGLVNHHIYSTAGVRYNSKNVLPCLLSLSALTEAMEDEKIPIVELAKIELGNNFETLDNIETLELLRQHLCEYYINGELYRLEYNETNGFAKYRPYDGDKYLMECCNQFQLFEWLFEHHFDVYNWIEAGKAIDKRTIKNIQKWNTKSLG
jgi:hypothetical protein